MLNRMPLAHAIQAQALYYQLRDHPVELRHTGGAIDRAEQIEEERILNG